VILSAAQLAVTNARSHKTEAQTSHDHDKIIDHVASSEHEELFMNGVFSMILGDDARVLQS
jgi:hypothetical protein